MNIKTTLNQLVTIPAMLRKEGIRVSGMTKGRNPPPPPSRLRSPRPLVDRLDGLLDLKIKHPS